jgi:hypothetical protein
MKSLVIFVLLLLLPFVESGVFYFPIVICKSFSFDETVEVCATYSGFIPVPAIDGNETVYLGGYGTTFQFWKGLPNGTNIDEEAIPPEADANLTVAVFRDDNNNNSCTVAVNDVNCTSCDYCGNETYSTDCTNIQNGRSVECEPLYPIYFPLLALPQQGEEDNVTSADRPTSSASVRGTLATLLGLVLLVNLL